MFTQNNNFNSSNNNNGGGEQKRTNFPIGKIWGSDGRLELSVWCADNGVKYIWMIKSEIGKDPTTGASTLEQRKATELPRYFMSIDEMKAFIESFEKCNDYGSINFIRDKGNNNKLSIVGNGGSIKITIDSQKFGNRTLTLDSIACGSTNVHASFMNLYEMTKIAWVKALRQKLDPDEFPVGSDEE